MPHAIVRTDNMSATRDGSKLVSLRYGTGTVTFTDADIDNGNICVVGDLISGERELHRGMTPTATSEVNTLVLVATPEIIYDETTYHGLEEFYNAAGKAIRGYRFTNGDKFAITADGFTGTPAVGKFATVGADTKLIVADSVSEGDISVGKIIATEVYNSNTYYVVLVTM